MGLLHTPSEQLDRTGGDVVLGNDVAGDLARRRRGAGAERGDVAGARLLADAADGVELAADAAEQLVEHVLELQRLDRGLDVGLDLRQRTARGLADRLEPRDR